MTDASGNLCPLGHSCISTEIRRIPTSEIRQKWLNSYQVKLEGPFILDPFVIEYQCGKTGLFYFTPSEAAGDAQMYEKLGQFSWYYMDEKWEHQEVLRRMPTGGRLLEIGCGNGGFLGSAKASGWASAEGLEFNAQAASVACEKGHDVHADDVLDFADRFPGAYDMVCAFQVLEHVPNPYEFISAAKKLVRVGGQVVFAVPNADSLLGRTPNLLDQPPHHMSRWGKQAFRMVGQELGLKLLFTRNEPLAKYHVKWYVASSKLKGRLGRVLDRCGMNRVYSTLTWMLNRYGTLRKYLSGHTHLACFERTA